MPIEIAGESDISGYVGFILFILWVTKLSMFMMLQADLVLFYLLLNCAWSSIVVLIISALLAFNVGFSNISIGTLVLNGFQPEYIPNSKVIYFSFSTHMLAKPYHAPFL